jgi:hypothetical protein
MESRGPIRARRPGRPLVVVLAAACLLVTWVPAVAQDEPPRIAQGGDGTLYLITGNERRTIEPEFVGDDVLDSLTDSGTIGGILPPELLGIIGRVPNGVPIAPEKPPPAVTGLLQPLEKPITYSGEVREVHEGYGWGTFDTAHFSLAGGDYVVSWTATSIGNVRVHSFRASLRRELPDDDYRTVTSFSGDVEAGKTASGKISLTGDVLGKSGYPALDPGNYYFDIGPSFDPGGKFTWSVTIAPL